MTLRRPLVRIGGRTEQLPGGDTLSKSALPTLTAADVGAAAADDARLTNSREWTATTVSQAEAEAGTATTRRAWTAQRVRQAITAWWAGLTVDASKITTGTFAAARIPTLNQSTTGNAATATKLATARTINGVAFDGTANITLGTDWSNLANKPATYAPSAHSHAVSDVTGLVAALGGKQNTLVPGAGITIDPVTNEISAAGAEIDFAIIYPNGGSPASPANVTTGSRYVEANPFPGHHVLCVVQVLVGGVWGDISYSIYSTNTNGIFVGQAGDTIVVKTAGSYLRTATVGYNVDVFSAAGQATSLPCRVKVWKVKGVSV